MSELGEEGVGASLSPAAWAPRARSVEGTRFSEDLVRESASWLFDNGDIIAEVNAIGAATDAAAAAAATEVATADAAARAAPTPDPETPASPSASFWYEVDAETLVAMAAAQFSEDGSGDEAQPSPADDDSTSSGDDASDGDASEGSDSGFDEVADAAAAQGGPAADWLLTELSANTAVGAAAVSSRLSSESLRRSCESSDIDIYTLADYPRRAPDEPRARPADAGDSPPCRQRPHAKCSPQQARFPLLDVVRLVDATFEMFFEDLCAVYDIDALRFRAYLVRRFSAALHAKAAADPDDFIPEEWIAKYCRHEARRSQTSEAWAFGAAFFDDDESKGSGAAREFKGWLFKRGGQILQAWTRRLFVLEGRVLRYAAGEAEPPKELALCGACSVVEAAEGFSVHTPKRTLYLRGADEWHQKAWVAMLRSAVNRAGPGGDS
ncbi:hypothetical protein M885DRAFT_513035 [Pelagophyceae sp. CCMP2097]|nr:hypothetical protein M885DRAFT_513035 [Pelagophyceae sp. CCMP2097]|mmetsp:Transcript_21181/g.73078  ORF Transcript_21181/g.73078 Transcript_21181/m.73078 type:complete len:438 (-) Transcript_21181:28-1341(-)